MLSVQRLWTELDNAIYWWGYQRWQHISSYRSSTGDNAAVISLQKEEYCHTMKNVYAMVITESTSIYKLFLGEHRKNSESDGMGSLYFICDFIASVRTSVCEPLWASGPHSNNFGQLGVTNCGTKRLLWTQGFQNSDHCDRTRQC